MLTDMKNVKQDKGMGPSSGSTENAKTNAQVPAPQDIFDYSDPKLEEKDLAERARYHDKHICPWSWPANGPLG
jgi:hypothetical protein